MKQQKKQAGVTVFYSYAHEDESLREQLEKRLSMLRRQGLISEWHDRQIAAGTEWTKEIDEHLEAASVILLLVSSDFLASNYCYDVEMQRALKHHARGEARVIPVILRPCEWREAPFAHLQVLPHDGKSVIEWNNPDAAFLDITQGIRQAIEQQTSSARHLLPLSLVEWQNRTRLLKRVRATWIEGLLEQSLYRAAWIDLHLQERPDALENPWRLEIQELDRTPRPLPSGTSIAEVYDEADGELLILGEPGSGKTTLLLELTRTLLERAKKEERFPMPIVFNLSSWAEKRQSLSLWLVEELWMKYQVPRKIGQGWIDADQVLPLLDGLDEVAKEARPGCVQQINDYYQLRLEHGNGQIVVCCRSEEYATLPTRVMLQHAVSILPLTDEQVYAYLEQAGESVKELKQALNEDAELHSLAHQPLMLNIFTLAYQGAAVAEVPVGATYEEVRHIILAQYVKRMLKRRKQPRRWKTKQVIHWLMFQAKLMQQHDQTVFSVENLQPTWLSRTWRLLYQCSLALFRGLVFGLLGVLVGGLIGMQVGGLGLVLVGGLVGGLSMGLVAGPVGELIEGQVRRLNTGIHLAGVLTRSRKKALSGLVAGLVGGGAVGLIEGLVAGVVRGLVAGPVEGLIAGLLFGLIAALGIQELLTVPVSK